MFKEYRALLTTHLNEARSQEGRSIYTRVQVMDVLLDLWNALDADAAVEGMEASLAELEVPEPA